MIHMISFQNGKSISQIMFLMSNKTSRDAFRKNERVIKYSVATLMVFSFFILTFGISDYDDKRYRIVSLHNFLLMWATKNLILFLLNIMSGITLLVVLRKKYYFEY